jgi:hypothetical protein
VNKPTTELKAFGKPIYCSLVKVKQSLTLNQGLASFVTTKTPGLLKLVIIKWQLDLLLNIKKTALFSLANIKVEKTQIQHLLRFEVY